MIEHQLLFKLVLLAVYLPGRGICVGTYVIGFHEGLTSCKDFTNNLFNGDELDLGKSRDDGENAMFLEGCVEFIDTVNESTIIDVEIEKETELGYEPMWSCSMDVCKSLNDKSAPWTEAMNSMNITKCPVAKGKYCCKEFNLDMSFANDFLNYNNRGNYVANIKISDRHMHTLSCHQLGLSIFQKEDFV